MTARRRRAKDTTVSARAQVVRSRNASGDGSCGQASRVLPKALYLTLWVLLWVTESGQGGLGESGRRTRAARRGRTASAGDNNGDHAQPRALHNATATGSHASHRGRGCGSHPSSTDVGRRGGDSRERDVNTGSSLTDVHNRGRRDNRASVGCGVCTTWQVAIRKAESEMGAGREW